MTGPRRATLSEVAATAGVSVASASRALSGASASPEMVRRVRRAADELGYVADAAARSLKVRRTDQLVLAVADLGNQAYVDMMRAVEPVIRAAGYRLVLVSMGNDVAAALDVVRGLNRGYADGLIIVPLRITDELIAEMRRAPVPVVVVGGLPPHCDLDNVRANSVRGMSLAVEHLVDTGRRRLALLNGPADTTPGQARRRGFRRAVRSHGLPPQPEYAAEDFTAEAGQKAVVAMLGQLADNGALPDALVCANDLLAVGAMRTLSARGLRVPDDIAVVGADNTELAEWTSLTSVDLGSKQRGLRAAGLLLDRLADPSRETTRVTVAPNLAVRETTRADSGHRSDGGRR